MELSENDRATLQRLEESLWREATRFDRNRMNDIFAPDFYEIGGSGSIWNKEQCLATTPQTILAVVPLPEFQARLIHPDVAQVTYNSVVTYGGIVQHSRRSSLWTRTSSGWQLRFHQGTPYENKASSVVETTRPV